MTVAERFWSKVDKTGDCWLWTAGVDSAGYGVAWDGTKRIKAHRYSWQTAHGPIPDGAQVLHHCDVRRCVRDAHLFLGDNSMNVADKMAKGRHRAQPRGEENTRALLTAEDVAAIRTLYASGSRQTELARRYGVAQTQISRIVRREQWSHV